MTILAQISKETTERVLSMIELHAIGAAGRFRACRGELASIDSIAVAAVKGSTQR